MDPIERNRANPLLALCDRRELRSYFAAERGQSTILAVTIDQRSAQLLFETLYGTTRLPIGQRVLGLSELCDKRSSIAGKGLNQLPSDTTIRIVSGGQLGGKPRDLAGSALRARRCRCSFKMALSTSAAGINTVSVSLATSLDGVNWTVLGVAFEIGTGWESSYIATTGALVKDGSTYRIFYGGYNGTNWQGGEASKSSFSAGGWTKNAANPLLKPRGGYDIPITANTAASSKIVKVANSALFDVGAPTLMWGATANSQETNIIAAIPDSTTLTMVRLIKETTQQQIAPRLARYTRALLTHQVWFEDGKWKMRFTAFQFRPSQLRETVGYAESENLAAGFAIQPSVWPLPLTSNSRHLIRLARKTLRSLGSNRFPSGNDHVPSPAPTKPA